MVDDEPDVEHLFRQQFRRDIRSERFVMEFAASAPEALERAKAIADPLLPTTEGSHATLGRGLVILRTTARGVPTLFRPADGPKGRYGKFFAKGFASRSPAFEYGDHHRANIKFQLAPVHHAYCPRVLF